MVKHGTAYLEMFTVKTRMSFSPMTVKVNPNMQLSYVQKKQLFENGYVHVPGVVPQVLVDRALTAINHSLGEGIDPAQINIYRSQSYCPELRKSPVIADLLNKSPAIDLAQSAIGTEKIQPVTGGQIALRFPALQDPPPAPVPHIDGTYSPNNGVPKGEIRNFTMLLGVMLSDVAVPYAGNFTVWPGTHHLFEQYFRENGADKLVDGMPKIDHMPQPIQMMGRAGDVVLCHYQLAHTAAINVSPHTRYAIYFRLKHLNHGVTRPETLTDIWLDWEGMRAFAPQTS